MISGAAVQRPPGLLVILHVASSGGHSAAASCVLALWLCAAEAGPGLRDLLL